MTNPASSGLPPLRRLVTFHDEYGKAIVQRDTLISSEPSDIGDGLYGGTLWITTEFPSKDSNTSDNGGQRQIEDPSNFGLVHPKGTNLRFTDLAPGAITPMHRTSSIDYNILIQGELILIMEDGSETHLKNPGDVVVQRGTVHAWRNPGSVITRWITTLAPAEGAVVNGQTLEPCLMH